MGIWGVVVVIGLGFRLLFKFILVYCVLKVRQSCNIYFKLTIISKNEQMNSVFMPNILTALWSTVLFIYRKNSRIAKSPFEINWPLAKFIQSAVIDLSLDMIRFTPIRKQCLKQVFYWSKLLKSIINHKENYSTYFKSRHIQVLKIVVLSLKLHSLHYHNV